MESFSYDRSIFSVLRATKKEFWHKKCKKGLHQLLESSDGMADKGSHIWGEMEMVKLSLEVAYSFGLIDEIRMLMQTCVTYGIVIPVHTCI